MSVTEDKVLSIVIPCYNEKDNILNIVKLVQASPQTEQGRSWKQRSVRLSARSFIMR